MNTVTGDKRLNIFGIDEIKNSRIWGYIFLIIFYLGALVCVWIRKDLFGIGFMGLLVFIGSLISGHFLSEKGDLSSGEVRRSITISFIFIFFALVAFGDKIIIDCKNKIAEKVLENYWVLMVTIIGFYFGARSVENVVKNKKQTP